VLELDCIDDSDVWLGEEEFPDRILSPARLLGLKSLKVIFGEEEIGKICEDVFGAIQAPNLRSLELELRTLYDMNQLFRDFITVNNISLTHLNIRTNIYDPFICSMLSVVSSIGHLDIGCCSLSDDLLRDMVDQDNSLVPRLHTLRIVDSDFDSRWSERSHQHTFKDSMLIEMLKSRIPHGHKQGLNRLENQLKSQPLKRVSICYFQNSLEAETLMELGEMRAWGSNITLDVSLSFFIACRYILNSTHSISRAMRRSMLSSSRCCG
jgi:hypothetical protein